MDKKVTDSLMSELLVSRLCHELVGAAGAIGNGVEYIAENSDVPIETDVLELMGISSKQLTSRLKYYRIAYGFSGAIVDNLAELRSLAFALYSDDEMITLEWPMAPVAPNLGDGEGRLILNMILLARSLLPKGGGIVVNVEDDVISIDVKGEDARITENLATILAGEFLESALTPRNIHDYYTFHQVVILSKDIIFNTDDFDDQIEIIIKGKTNDN